MNRIPIGKLPPELLRDLLRRYVRPDPRVVVGPGIGQDAAIIDLGDRYLVAKTDPVTFATDQIGWYAVHVNANDIACCGATPRWYLATLLLPEAQTTPELAEAIFAQIDKACTHLGVSLCGGHTEVTHGLDRPIVVGHMLGEVGPDQYVTSRGAKVGDALILTKGFAIEGTALLAKEKHDELRGAIPEETLQRCAQLLQRPGISVVQEAQRALTVGDVHAFHDPTEGGVATGLWELAEASGVGMVIDQDALPLLPECEVLCRFFRLDPLGLLGSGSLLIAASPTTAPAIVQDLQTRHIRVAIIGEVTEAKHGCSMRSASGAVRPLPRFERDEITRLF